MRLIATVCLFSILSLWIPASAVATEFGVGVVTASNRGLEAQAFARGRAYGAEVLVAGTRFGLSISLASPLVPVTEYDGTGAVASTRYLFDPTLAVAPRLYLFGADRAVAPYASIRAAYGAGGVARSNVDPAILPLGTLGIGLGTELRLGSFGVGFEAGLQPLAISREARSAGAAEWSIAWPVAQVWAAASFLLRL